MTILRKGLLGLLLLVAILVVAAPLLAIALVGLAIVSAFTLVVVLWAIVILGETWVDVGLKDYSFWDALDESLGDVLTGLAVAILAYRRRNRTPLVQRVRGNLPLIGRRVLVALGLVILPGCFLFDLLQKGYREARKAYAGIWSDTIVPAWNGRSL